jgi:hypothetical protein
MPTKPGFTPTRATRFRRAFRAVCDYYQVTNAILGDAVDAHLVWARKAEFGGHKWVDNTMMANAPLAHVAARRLVAVLFLARDRNGAFAIADDKVAKAELGELLWLLRRLGALCFDPEPVVPAFIAPEHVAQFADELAGVITAVPGVGWRRRPSVANKIAGYLRELSGPMNRAWRRASLDVAVLQAARLSEDAARPVLDQLSRATFREAYVFENEVPGYGPEFETLFRERDLFGFLFPPFRRAPSRLARRNVS